MSPNDRTHLPGPFGRAPTSPSRFASSTNAFGLAASPSSSSSSSSRDHNAFGGFGAGNGGLTVETSPTIGTHPTRRLRRPSMLSLAQNASFLNDSTTAQIPVSPKTARSRPIQDPSSSKAVDTQAQATILQKDTARSSGRHSANPFASHITGQTARWGSDSTPSPFLANPLLRRTSSAPLAFDELTTHTPPPSTPVEDLNDDGADMSGAINEPTSPLRWMPNHMQSSSARRKGKARMSDHDISDPTPAASVHAPPFTGRPLHASLLATLISESTPLEHEMRSEARLQKLLSSHPSVMPLTPRAPRSSRGRFPETAGDDDDDDELYSRSWSRRNWLGRRQSSSDSDSDDMTIEEPEQGEPVNSAFAAGMDMDRPGSSTDSSNSGPSGRPESRGIAFGGTNGQQWPKSSSRMTLSTAGSGMVPSPGTGLALPSAFGGLGMGTGTPLASPTIERLEFATSPGSVSVTSPGMMQYRDSGSASVRPGKRKAVQEDRFDPYKRPRGSSPSLLSASPGLAMSPSRTTSSMPIPQSPSHVPTYPSGLSSSQNSLFVNTRSTRPYPRQIPRSKSRAASPALSIGSTSGVLSTSLGNNGNTVGGRPSFSLGQAFIPTGSGSGAVPPTGAAQGLGGLGLLSLSNSESVREGREDEEEEGGGVEMLRGDSGASRDAMEED